MKGSPTSGLIQPNLTSYRQFSNRRLCYLGPHASLTRHASLSSSPIDQTNHGRVQNLATASGLERLGLRNKPGTGPQTGLATPLVLIDPWMFSCSMLDRDDVQMVPVGDPRPLLVRGMAGNVSKKDFANWRSWNRSVMPCSRLAPGPSPALFRFNAFRFTSGLRSATTLPLQVDGQAAACGMLGLGGKSRRGLFGYRVCGSAKACMHVDLGENACADFAEEALSPAYYSLFRISI